LSERVVRFLDGPEGLEVEFKSNLKGLDPSDITAFANARGGTVLIGVQEKKKSTGERYGTVVGVKGIADSTQAVQDMVTSCNPKLEVKISEERDEKGLSILVVDVPEGPAKPYWTGAGLYVIRRSGRTDAIDPLLMRDLLAGAHEVQESAFPCLLIANDVEGNIPEHLFRGYRFLMKAHLLWQAVTKQQPDTVLPRRGSAHQVLDRPLLVGATVEAALLDWLCQLSAIQFYFDGRASPSIPRLLFNSNIPKKTVTLDELQPILSGNPLLKVLGEGAEGFGLLQPLTIPQSFNLDVERFDPMKDGSLLTRIRLHGDDGEISIDVFLGSGFRGIPSNTPQSVTVPTEEAQRYWMDVMTIVFRTSFPRASRERPNTEAYRGWAADLLRNLKLLFDWSDYAASLPDKEVIRTQLMLQEVLKRLDGNLTDQQKSSGPANERLER